MQPLRHSFFPIPEIPEGLLDRYLEQQPLRSWSDLDFIDRLFERAFVQGAKFDPNVFGRALRHFLGQPALTVFDFEYTAFPVVLHQSEIPAVGRLLKPVTKEFRTYLAPDQVETFTALIPDLLGPPSATTSHGQPFGLRRAFGEITRIRKPGKRSAVFELRASSLIGWLDMENLWLLVVNDRSTRTWIRSLEQLLAPLLAVPTAS